MAKKPQSEPAERGAKETRVRSRWTIFGTSTSRPCPLHWRTTRSRLRTCICGMLSGPSVPSYSSMAISAAESPSRTRRSPGQGKRHSGPIPTCVYDPEGDHDIPCGMELGHSGRGRRRHVPKPWPEVSEAATRNLRSRPGPRSNAESQWAVSTNGRSPISGTVCICRRTRSQNCSRS